MLSSNKLIARGRTAEVYAWETGNVLKLYMDWCPPDWVDHEAKIARAVSEAGVPSPAYREIVEVDGRRGIVYERVDGPSLLDSITKNALKIQSHARTLAHVHLEMHRAEPVGLPSRRGALEWDISNAPDLPEDLRPRILAEIDSLPDGNKLCHGDFHPGNVLMTQRGPLAIDWMTAGVWHPAGDVARTRLLLSVGRPPANLVMRLMILAIRRLFYNTYLSEYGKHSPEVVRLSDDFLPFMTAARLNERIAPERDTLIKVLRARWP
jgi:uncharacterized protein (TIGR02172 family)